MILRKQVRENGGKGGLEPLQSIPKMKIMIGIEKVFKPKFKWSAQYLILEKETINQNKCQYVQFKNSDQQR